MDGLWRIGSLWGFLRVGVGKSVLADKCVGFDVKYGPPIPIDSEFASDHPPLFFGVPTLLSDFVWYRGVQETGYY